LEIHVYFPNLFRRHIRDGMIKALDIHKTQAEMLANAIRQEIVRGGFKPGERLGMTALQDRYDVGVSPLREALSRLTTLGLVTAEGQRGFRVAQVSAADLMDLMKTMAWVESTALRSAIAHGDRNWEAEIMASAHRLGINNRGQSAARFFDEMWEENHRLFHRSLVAACKAPRLLDYRALLYENVDRYRRLSALYERGTRDVDGEHRALVDAVLNRDPEKAADVMQDHLLETTRNLLRNDPEIGGRTDVLIAQLVEDIAAGQSQTSGGRTLKSPSTAKARKRTATV
jgi:GntR family carbon starvation induced transcriptional regulator